MKIELSKEEIDEIFFILDMYLDDEFNIFTNESREMMDKLYIKFEQLAGS
ncbi:MAG: hypothetical protein PHH73_02010 [Candidatus Rickettsiella isopodorum]|nr:hypothetical protein [Candidatus Rickettsiella isopodorum]